MPNARKGPEPRFLYKFGVLKTYYNVKGVAKQKTEPHFVSIRQSTVKALGLKVQVAKLTELRTTNSKGGFDYYPQHKGSRFLKLYKKGSRNKTGVYQIPIPPSANRKHITDFLAGSRVDYFQLEGKRYPFGVESGK